MAEEARDPFCGKVIQFERFNPSPCVFCCVTQEQEYRIAVTAEGMQAHSTLGREIFLKEAVQGPGQNGWETALHRAPPRMSRPNRCSKRSLARRCSVGTQRR